MNSTFLIDPEVKTWAEMTDEQRKELYVQAQSFCVEVKRERDYLRALLLSQSGRTADEINSILRGW